MDGGVVAGLLYGVVALGFPPGAARRRPRLPSGSAGHLSARAYSIPAARRVLLGCATGMTEGIVPLSLDEKRTRTLTREE